MQKSKLQCGFGLLGLCCTECLQGPCRIDPFQRNIQHAICGESADIIVINNLLKRLAIGTVISANYGCQLLERTITDNRKPITDIKAVAEKLGIKGQKNLLDRVVQLALKDYSGRESTTCNWLKLNLTSQKFNLLSKYRVLPDNIYHSIIEALAPVPTDINEMLLIGLRCSLANLNLLYLVSDLVQIVDNIPQWCASERWVDTGPLTRIKEEQSKELQDQLVGRIKSNELSGIALFVGCTELSQKESAIFDELSENGVIPLLIGCQNKDYSSESSYRGSRIGSCIETAKIANLVNELSFRLGIDGSIFPIIAIFCEQIDRRIEVMAYWMIALGIPVYWMKVPPIVGSTIATEFFTKTVNEWFGGYFIWEKGTTELIKILQDRAKNSGIKPI